MQTPSSEPPSEYYIVVSAQLWLQIVVMQRTLALHHRGTCNNRLLVAQALLHRGTIALLHCH